MEKNENGKMNQTKKTCSYESEKEKDNHTRIKTTNIKETKTEEKWGNNKKLKNKIVR